MAGLLINTGGFSPTTGTLGSGVVFPDGHIRFLSQSAVVTTYSVVADGDIFIDHPTGTFTAGSKILVEFIIGGVYTDTTGLTYGHGYLVGAAASTGTASDSGLGATTSGLDILQEIGYGWAGTVSNPGYAVLRVVTPINGATTASYNFLFDERADGRLLSFYKMYMTCWEIYQ